MASKAGTAYDAAIDAAATQAEKDRLRELRLRFNLPPDLPEWQFYAVLAPLLTFSTDREDLGAQLERIETSVRRNDNASSVQPIAGPTRDLLVFTVAVLLCVATAAAIGVAPTPFVVVLAAFALGLCVAFGYLWLAPRIVLR